MNQQPEVLAADWALVTELLERKHHDLPGEFHHTAFEQPPTSHVPRSASVALSAEMLVIALHAVLTRVEETIAESSETRYPGAGVWPIRIHECPGPIPAGLPAHQRCEARQAARDDERTTDSPAPVSILRRLLAEALQCGEMSLAEGVACMQALDDGERRTWEILPSVANSKQVPGRSPHGGLEYTSEPAGRRPSD